MDGLRKVPDNIPNAQLLTDNLGKPLTRIPDPFGTHESFAHHNNAMLRAFLDRFGFDYDFFPSTDYYVGGRFEDALMGVISQFDALIAELMATLRGERRATCSPVLPDTATSGAVRESVVQGTREAGTWSSGG